MTSEISDEGIEAAAKALMAARDNPGMFDVFPPQEVIDAATDLARTAITAYLATQRAPDEERCYELLFQRLGHLIAVPAPRTVHRYKDPNTGEREASAECKWCHAFIEMYGTEEGGKIHWVHSDSLGAERCVQAARDAALTPPEAPDEELSEARRSGQIAMTALINACNDGWSDGTGALESYLRDARLSFDAAALTPPDDGTGQ